MLKVLLLVALILVLPGFDDTHSISPIDKASIIKRILSTDSPSSAWGAYYAGKSRLKESIPTLLELVKRQNRRLNGPVPLVKKAALDALIRLDADVPAGLLYHGLNEVCLAETLILLAKNPEKNRNGLFYLMDYDDVDNQHWWATAAVLTSLNPLGLAERLLKEARLTLCVTVCDQGEKRGSTCSEGSGGLRSWSATANLYPPKSTYIFSTNPEKGAVVLQAKPIVIYYQRSEDTRRSRTGGIVGPITRSKYAFKFLRTMLAKAADDFHSIDMSSLTINWVNEQDYIDKVNSKLCWLRINHKRLLDMLYEQYLLSTDACNCIRPMIEIKVYDKRRDKNPPLPIVSSQE